jgi:hypothetical protein
MSELLKPSTLGQGLVGIDGRTIGGGSVPWFDEEQDTKDFIFEKLGDLEDIEFLFNEVLVAKYIREEVGAGLIAAPETKQADVWEGVIGLVLKVGPRAFVDDEDGRTQFHGKKVEVGDWALFRNSDGWDKDIAMLGSRTNFVKCRIIQDAHIRGRVKYPARIY